MTKSAGIPKKSKDYWLHSFDRMSNYLCASIYHIQAAEGFNGYFSFFEGGYASEALEGLREMGAVRTAAVLERAMAVFPAARPPTDRDEREKVMWQIETQSESVWRKCNDEAFELWETEDIVDLLFAYATKKRAEIVLT